MDNIDNIDKANQELLIRAAKRGVTKLRDFMMLKNEISTEFKIDSLPNYGLTQVYEKLVKTGKIKPLDSARGEQLLKLFKKAKMRTLSGVAVVSVLTKEYSCPGNCLYCPTEKNMPKSYLSNEPAVMRAILCEFDPYRQVAMRLDALKKSGHSTDKIELIIMGGSFNALPEEYQYWFVRECFRACNKVGGKNIQYPISNIQSMSNDQFSIKELKTQLNLEQRKNEKAKARIIGLTLETRPDLITENELKKFREMGCTRIEIGVQSIYNEVLKKNLRGHGVAEIINATKLMKDFGFKVSYHMMPGLYGSNLKKDLQMFKDLFNDSRFQPDQIKIYPCVVVKNTGLYKLWKAKKYKPYTDKQLIKLICDIKKIIPPYVRISRLIRDIPEESIEAGNKITNLRQVIANRSQLENWQCKCIRCREVRDTVETNGRSSLRINQIKYPASGGKEVFLGLINNHYQLYAMLRLRLPVGNSHGCSLQNAAIIREVHTYGEALDVGEVGVGAEQHKGLGKKLIIESEKIAKKAGYDKIAVISGVGAREYYRKLGYKLAGSYMVKMLKCVRTRTISSGVERSLDVRKATGSKPVSSIEE